jgi:hypothetical protein
MLNNERKVWQGKNIAFNEQGLLAVAEFEKRPLEQKPN